MMPLKRAEQPAILRQNQATWTANYLSRLAKYEEKKARGQEPRKPKFTWPQRDNKPLNQHLNPTLLAMSANHCAYCDGFPMGAMSLRTIDHFKPKEHFAELAYSWANLYPCCNACQDAKGSDYDQKLLRPDDGSYEFAHYFLFNYRTGDLDINPFATADKQDRARKTLEILGLNDRDRDLPAERARVYIDQTERDSDTRAYRFMFTDETSTGSVCL